VKPKPDLTGRKRVGVASFYADMFAGRQMADGNTMNPQGANAASRTLPLGTTAKVTNIETGKSAIVTIQDRGPYVDGRIVDLSPGTAQKIGITRRQGLSKVVVAPIAVPLPNGEVKAGAALKEAAPELVPAAEAPTPSVPKRAQSHDMPTSHHEVPSPPPDKESKAIRVASNRR
jgi:rare lipoprotein A